MTLNRKKWIRKCKTCNEYSGLIMLHIVRQEKQIEVTKMRMLRWMCKDKIRNEHIRGTTRVAQASKKVTERRLNWYGHVMRRDGEHILRKVLRADIPGKRKRGRPKTRWKDACQRDWQSTGLRAGEETDRAMWRRKIISHTGDPTWWEKSEEK